MSKTPHDHFFMDDEDLEDELSSGQTGEGSEDEMCFMFPLFSRLDEDEQ